MFATMQGAMRRRGSASAGEERHEDHRRGSHDSHESALDDGGEDIIMNAASFDVAQHEYTLKELIHGIVAGYPLGAEPAGAWLVASYVVTNLVFLVIALSVASFAVTTLPQYKDGNPVTDSIEIFCVAVFTLELVVRAVSAASQLAFWANPLTWIDVLSILPYYIALILAGDSGASALVFFRVLRLIRVTRVFKLMKNNIGFEAVFESMVTSKEALSLMGFMLVVAVCTFSAAIYFAELDGNSFDTRSQQWIRPSGDVNPFQSMFHAMWWCIVTITTVGYGDDVPVTGGGKFIAAVAAVCGVFVISFPSAILGANFADIHHRKIRERDELLKRSRKNKAQRDVNGDAKPGVVAELGLPATIQSSAPSPLATKGGGALSSSSFAPRTFYYIPDDDVPPREVTVTGNTATYAPSLTMLTQESDRFVLMVRQELLFPQPSRNLVFTLILASESVELKVQAALAAQGLDPSKLILEPRQIHSLTVTVDFPEDLTEMGVRVTTLEYALPVGHVPLVFFCPDETAENSLMNALHRVDIKFKVGYAQLDSYVLPLSNYRTAALVRTRTMAMSGRLDMSMRVAPVAIASRPREGKQSIHAAAHPLRFDATEVQDENSVDGDDTPPDHSVA